MALFLSCNDNLIETTYICPTLGIAHSYYSPSADSIVGPDTVNMNLGSFLYRVSRNDMYSHTEWLAGNGVKFLDYFNSPSPPIIYYPDGPLLPGIVFGHSGSGSFWSNTSSDLDPLIKYTEPGEITLKCRHYYQDGTQKVYSPVITKTVTVVNWSVPFSYSSINYANFCPNGYGNSPVYEIKKYTYNMHTVSPTDPYYSHQLIRVEDVIDLTSVEGEFAFNFMGNFTGIFQGQLLPFYSNKLETGGYESDNFFTLTWGGAAGGGVLIKGVVNMYKGLNPVVGIQTFRFDFVSPNIERVFLTVQIPMKVQLQPGKVF